MTSKVNMTLASCRLQVPTSEHLSINAQTWGLIQRQNLFVIATGHNLESYPNQLSKFGYHQTPDRLLTDS